MEEERSVLALSTGLPGMLGMYIMIYGMDTSLVLILYFCFAASDTNHALTGRVITLIGWRRGQPVPVDLVF